MHARVTDHATIIKQLGGYAELAERIGVDPITAYRWTRNGIPMERWNAIIEVAAERDIILTLDELDAGRPAEPLPATRQTKPKGSKHKRGKRTPKGTGKRRAS